MVGSPTQLRQVLHNLLLNAQDALGDVAEPRIVVRTELVAAGAGQRACVRLSVVDNGCGFPPSMLERVFEPYVTTKTKGTGLGLAVVKKIADEHNTRVDIMNRMVDGQPAGAQVSLSFATDNAEPAQPLGPVTSQETV